MPKETKTETLVEAIPYDLDLDAALEDVLREARTDEVPDVLHHQDYRERWPTDRKELIAALATKSYHPQPARLVEVPKSSLATRPIAVLSMVDRALYEAVMQRLGPSLDKTLSEEVFSARLKQNKAGRWRPEKQVRSWVKFEKAGRDMCDDYDQACLLTTDITSYFEFVELGTLLKSIKGVPGIDVPVVDVLSAFLNGVTGDATDLHGVPQGPEVSSILGNFYLLPLDAVLRKLDVRWIRFQDDIKVFASEPHVLRLAVRELMPAVRGRHLNLSSAKTKLLQGSAVLEHFEDSKKDAIQYGLDIESPDVLDDLRALFDDAVSGSEVNERDVRFAINRFRKLGDDYAVTWILKNLDTVPYLASYLVTYLTQHFEKRPEIEAEVRSFLQDAARNISPVVEMHLIRMLGRAPQVSGETYDVLWSILKDQTKEGFVREWAARSIGRHVKDDGARLPDVDLLRSLFKLSMENHGLRRALLVGIYEAESVDKAWLSAVATSDESLRHTCEYLRKKPELLPP